MAEKYLMVVGSLNRETPYFQGARGVGLSVFDFDTATGSADLICEDRSVDNPTFLTVDPRSGCVYANSEVSGWHEGTVTAYRLDPQARRLRYLNKQPSLGSTTAHSSLDRTGSHLLVANYGMGAVEEGPDRAVVVYPLNRDGSLGTASASVSHKGQGPHADRQDRSHPHCVLPSPDGRFAVATDLGLDAILTYRYGSDGSLSAAPVATAPLPPGAGPRHIAFHPNGHLAMVICELDSTLSSLRYAPDTGQFTRIGTVTAVPKGSRVENYCSDVQIHPNGRFVYGANRGDDSVVILEIDPESGRLTTVGHHPSGGVTPRNLAIDPTGRFLIVANQNSDVLTVLTIDAQNGRLAPAGREIAIGTPMCVKFMAA